MSKSSGKGSSYYKSFMTCPKKFEYEYIENLSIKNDREPLIIGEAFHVAMQKWYTTIGDYETRLNIAIEAAILVIDNSSIVTKEDTMQYICRMVEAYCNHYTVEDFKVIRSEMPIEIVLPSGIVYTVRLDLLIHRNGKYLVVDHKTTGLPLATYFKTFSDDIQGVGYVYAAARACGLPVEGIMINAVYKKRDKERSFEFGRDFIYKTEKDFKEFEELISYYEYSIEECKADFDIVKTFFPKNRTQCVKFYGGALIECDFRRLCSFGDTKEMREAFYKEEE